jgi:methyltransferase-like protein
MDDLGGPIYQTHPDALATPAFLVGMSPAPVEKCRFLEVGCGANLIALAAALPESRFIGVHSSRQIVDSVKEVVDSVNLSNVELHVAEVRDFDCGEIDYLVAHGIYSASRPETQAAIWSLAARRLAPQGVAYVSCNVLPGWRSLSRLRDLLLWGARSAGGDVERRARGGRQFAQIAAQVAGLLDEEYGKALRGGVERLSAFSDEELARDFMAPVNRPLLFHELASHAAEHGLQYLGESCRQSAPSDVPPSLRQWAGTRVLAEQCLDFVRDTSYRRSLFCRANIAPAEPRAALLSSLRMNTLCEPVSPQPDVAGPGEESFRGELGTLQTDMPLVKAILVHLHQIWPRTLGLPELVEAVRARVGPAADELVAQAALQCYTANLLALHLWAPQFSVEAGERPATGALQRAQAARGGEVTNLRHRSVKLEAFERVVLARLDGSRDRTALIGELGAPAERVEAALGRLARAALLVA